MQSVPILKDILFGVYGGVVLIPILQLDNNTHSIRIEAFATYLRQGTAAAAEVGGRTRATKNMMDTERLHKDDLIQELSLPSRRPVGVTKSRSSNLLLGLMICVARSGHQASYVTCQCSE